MKYSAPCLGPSNSEFWIPLSSTQNPHNPVQILDSGFSCMISRGDRVSWILILNSAVCLSKLWRGAIGFWILDSPLALLASHGFFGFWILNSDYCRMNYWMGLLDSGFWILPHHLASVARWSDFDFWFCPPNSHRTLAHDFGAARWFWSKSEASETTLKILILCGWLPVCNHLYVGSSQWWLHPSWATWRL